MLNQWSEEFNKHFDPYQQNVMQLQKIFAYQLIIIATFSKYFHMTINLTFNVSNTITNTYFYHKWFSFPFYTLLKAKQTPSKGRQKKKKRKKENEKAESKEKINEKDKAKDTRIIKRLTIHGESRSRWTRLSNQPRWPWLIYIRRRM